MTRSYESSPGVNRDSIGASLKSTEYVSATDIRREGRGRMVHGLTVVDDGPLTADTDPKI